MSFLCDKHMEFTWFLDNENIQQSCILLMDNFGIGNNIGSFTVKT